MLQKIDDYVNKDKSFAFETTFSGRLYVKKIKTWKSKGYEIVIYYLKLPSVDIAIERVKLRVAKGGHNISEKDIRRRFERSWVNFQGLYKYLADSWTVFDSSGEEPLVTEESGG